jgi:hypothetical protein
MDPTRLIPNALPIPVEWGWFYLFQVLTFIVHILVMNVMLGASIIALVHHLHGKADTQGLTKTISIKLPFTIAFAVNFGVAPLLFMQILYGQFLYSSSVLMAVYWIGVVGLVIAAYGSAYIYDFGYATLGNLRTFFIAVTTLCLLVTAFIFTNNMTLMLSPERWAAYFDNPWGTLLNLGDPTVLPRYLHIVASSTALAGLALAIFYSRKVNVDPGAQRWVRHGVNWYAFSTMVQMALGLWFLSALPEPVKHLLLGDSLPHTLIFAVSASLGIFSISNALRYNVGTTAILSLTTITLMILLRDMVRDAYLAPYFQVSDRVVTGEYLPLVIFILTLAAGLCVIAWMLRAAARDSEVRS